MATTSATIPTADGARLIKRLCAHWSHKFPVESSEGHGDITFDAWTRVRLNATDETLVAAIETADAAYVTRLQDVVAEHLNRMARGETLTITWSAVS